MKIYSVYDKEFAPFGRVVTGMDEAAAELMDGLKNTPITQLSRVVDCYTGTLPDHNEIGVYSLQTLGVGCKGSLAF